MSDKNRPLGPWEWQRRQLSQVMSERNRLQAALEVIQGLTSDALSGDLDPRAAAYFQDIENVAQPAIAKVIGN